MNTKKLIQMTTCSLSFFFFFHFLLLLLFFGHPYHTDGKLGMALIMPSLPCLWKNRIENNKNHKCRNNYLNPEKLFWFAKPYCFQILVCACGRIIYFAVPYFYKFEFLVDEEYTMEATWFVLVTIFI